MGTVSKALRLLDVLSEAPNALGLTALAIATRFDKATTRRLLLELAGNGFVSQDENSRAYDLGPALQQLGRVREMRFPLAQLVSPQIKSLARKTQEMVHATEYASKALFSICMQESTYANRVTLDGGTKLPLHATASGIAFLAASNDKFIDNILGATLPIYTSKTVTDVASLKRSIQETRSRGYSICNQAYDEGVHSVAAAILGAGRKPVGTIAIARPTIRVTAENSREYGQLVAAAAAEVSAALGLPYSTKFKQAS